MKKILLLEALLLSVIVGCQAQKNDNLRYRFQVCSDSIKLLGNHVESDWTKRYVLYGKVDSVLSSGEKLFSDFHVLDCQKKGNKRFQFERELFWDSEESFKIPFDYVSVKKHGKDLVLRIYASIPVGKDWEYKLTPTADFVLNQNENGVELKSKKFLLTREDLNFDFGNEIQEEYLAIKQNEVNSYFKDQKGADYIFDFLVRLLVASFFNEKCFELYSNLEDDFPELTEGMCGEIYYSWKLLFDIYIEE